MYVNDMDDATTTEVYRVTEEGTCYDESPKCAKFSEQGRCTNDEAEPYASHCMRSCALCSKY